MMIGQRMRELAPKDNGMGTGSVELMCCEMIREGHRCVGLGLGCHGSGRP